MGGAVGSVSLSTSAEYTTVINQDENKAEFGRQPTGQHSEIPPGVYRTFILMVLLVDIISV